MDLAQYHDKIEAFLYELYAEVRFFSPYIIELLKKHFGYAHCTFFRRYSFRCEFPISSQYAQPTFVETVSLGLSREDLRLYYAGPYKDSIFLPENMNPALYAKPVLLVEDIMPMAEYKKTPAFAERLRNGFCYQMLIQLNFDGMQLGSISVLRREDAQDFTEEDRLLAQAVCPHIAQAYKLSVDKAFMRGQLKLARQFHQDLDYGSIILDNTFMVLTHNTKAQAYCLDIQARRDKAAHMEERPHVVTRGDGAVGDVQEFVSTNRERLWAELDKPASIETMGLEQRYSIAIKTLSYEDATGRMSIHYAVTMTARQVQALNPEACQHYGLTNREIQVAAYIVQGMSNKQISEQMFVSAHTTKTHITNLFNKTGTTKRAELTHKLGRGPGPGGAGA